ncbi:MAG: YicC family protein [Rhodoferax sp.]|nr:YicC family protein [Rhodoferax sp.]
MPVYSMTGYASAQHSIALTTSDSDTKEPVGILGLEIRCVNSRFLDFAFKLHEELRQFEPALRELLQTRLKRGKVEVRASVEFALANSVPSPTPRLLQRLGCVQDTVQAWLPSAASLSVADVMRLSMSGQTGMRDWSSDVLPLAQEVLDSLLGARAREGERLVAMLMENIARLRVLAQRVEPLVPQLVENSRQRFLTRWREAMGLVEGTVLPETAQERALTEATAFAIRIDVAEEITRLGSHLDELERLINKGGEMGKRLDFLIQELHREANTLGSKSAALELTHISVDMKVLIEQMREQVQNIE